MKRIFILLALVAGSSLALAELKPTTLVKPIFVEIKLNEGSDKITGSLLRFDADSLTIKNAKGEQRLNWSQLTLLSQHAIRSQIIDKKSAADWLDLAELAMKCDLREQAKVEVAAAARLDPSTRLKGDAILRKGAATTTAPVKYQKSTPDEDAKAIALFQQVGQAVGEELKIKLAEVQTQHFIIFTDWDPLEYSFLMTNCEEAYAAVSKQFDIPVRENVFVGKLPVFMFVRHEDFNRFANQIDRFAVPATWAGYYTSHTDGSGHLVMWKPDVKKYGAEAEKVWAYTLTHEFTHAFVARYRSNRLIPRWLNEGLAEVIAYGRFPLRTAHAQARAQAGRKFDFESLFDDKKFPGGEMYPVMQTMVEAMIADNRKAFIQMFDDIKDGMNPEEAMKKNYKAGYKDWEKAWRKYAKNLQD
jgi:hypothetical protein